jgi:hypothetical protein
MTKATSKVLANLAVVEARRKLSGPLMERCVAEVYSRLRRDREAIAAAFAPAVADELDILNKEARLLPQGHTAAHADRLSADQFATWTRCRDAHAAIEGLRLPLNALYPQHAAGGFAGTNVVAAMRYIEVPDAVTEVPDAHRFADAAIGKHRGGSSLGQVYTADVFAPTAVAHLGARFSWAGPAEVERRVALLTKAATPTVVERRSGAKAGVRS